MNFWPILPLRYDNNLSSPRLTICLDKISHTTMLKVYIKQSKFQIFTAYVRLHVIISRTEWPFGLVFFFQQILTTLFFLILKFFLSKFQIAEIANMARAGCPDQLIMKVTWPYENVVIQAEVHYKMSHK